MVVSTPRFKGIIFGDDYLATIIDERTPYRNPEGIELKQYLILPKRELVEAYPDLKRPGVLNVRTQQGMCIWVEYPTHWIMDGNPSKNMSFVRIDCTFDGRETPHTNRHAIIQDENKNLIMRIDSLNIHNLVLQEENKNLLKDIKTQIKVYNELAQLARQEFKQERTDEDDRPEE